MIREYLSGVDRLAYSYLGTKPPTTAEICLHGPCREVPWGMKTLDPLGYICSTYRAHPDILIEHDIQEREREMCFGPRQIGPHALMEDRVADERGPEEATIIDEQKPI